MERSNRYYFFDSKAMVAKVVQDGRALVQQSKDILLASAVNTFLGRKTQEPFPLAGPEMGDLDSHASQISTIGAGVSQSGSSNGTRSDAAGTAKHGIGVQSAC